jgi:CheY-like chemotaxis protein
MNVLMLEDRGATAYYVTRWLAENGHVVTEAFNPNDAENRWRQRATTQIDCIILDCQTPMDGLSEDQKARAEGGTLAGWVWLQDSVLTKEPQMRYHVIIYSDYVGVLREKVPAKELKDIRIVPKRGRTSAADEVVACIGEIGKLAGGQRT